ncbi:COP9 signalosome complex subunit 7b [Coemansia javaensis]|uniref:COP9 signalosome complex subunit 7b n=1 Tax=Coemansia javaensis TaxID=2761396 RepID=A0A9W8HFD3_9FUNG|nr:COP9 signalosome complex subunit 7b [Coemansia javaensis]
MDAHLASLAAAAPDDIPGVIERALADDSVYHFGKLLHAPKVAEAVAADERAQYGRVLELFAFGTLGDYKADASRFPPLTAPQVQKLKLLTLVGAAARAKTLPYDELAGELDCASEQELEDLVVEAIYKGLLAAKLDQRRRLVEVDFVAGRDVRREDLPGMHAQLEEWSGTCRDALAELTRDIEAANESARAKALDSREFAERLQELRAAHAAPAPEPIGVDRSDSQYASSEYRREEQRTRAEDP